MTESERQLSANDDVIFVYALFHSNDIWSAYFYDKMYQNVKLTVLKSAQRARATPHWRNCAPYPFDNR